MLLGALAFTTTACTNSEDVKDYGEITLTTPVVTLDGVTATVSRTTPNYSQMELHVDLLKSNGSAYENERSCTYTYSGEWSVAENYEALVVTSGEGDYHARAWATVNLAETETVPAITGAIYATLASAEMSVASTGTFDFSGDNALTPQTVAIQVKVLDPNEEKLTSDYTLTNKLGKLTTYSWDTSSVEETSDEFNGNYSPVMITEETEILNIVWNNTTYTVSTNSLTLEAGKFYTFEVKLGGGSKITIGGEGITVSPFTPAEDTIDIRRQ